MILVQQTVWTKAQEWYNVKYQTCLEDRYPLMSFVMFENVCLLVVSTLRVIQVLKEVRQGINVNLYC